MLSNMMLLKSSEENLDWFNDNFSKIQSEYANKIVAIKDRSIVGSSANIESLLDLLKQKGIDESEVLIEVVYSKDEMVILQYAN